MSVNPYLIFNGNCREAVEYYAEVFGAEKPRIMTFGSAPANPEYPLPEEAKNLVKHTRISVSGTDMMFSDNYPGMPYTAGNNISLAIVHNNLEEMKSYFEQLKADGKVRMELQETMWSKSYGSVVDKFGIEWQLTYASDETGK